MSNLKDKVTTWLAYLLVVLGALQVYLQANVGKPINWGQLSITLIMAVVSYFTGKTPAGTTKTPAQVNAGNSTDSTVVKS